MPNIIKKKVKKDTTMLLSQRGKVDSLALRLGILEDDTSKGSTTYREERKSTKKIL